MNIQMSERTTFRKGEVKVKVHDDDSNSLIEPMGSVVIEDVKDLNNTDIEGHN